eukprot:CAMPEP_0194775010 /NCGR_PEP_ID=MMETSP0323_2-20130528/59170_1 /TAXON_ID=2866 ORGANISM="Crypthecodinium cohnii, Strain Seligo" /NCGR_SAMPLE_ID=MMETSP0323_2 /ASSEMBLY_ACC=CAM_ASM_000346 /LENGTH=127 /DNA_ID=CAMNT_0039710815 /DNA_START=18 /DNA_END=398 /DNA_ORIENTATION=-
MDERKEGRGSGGLHVRELLDEAVVHLVEEVGPSGDVGEASVVLRILRVDVQETLDAIDFRFDLAVHDELDQQRSDLLDINVYLFRQEVETNATIGPDQILQNLKSNVAKKVLEVGANKGVGQDLVGW